MLINIKLIFKSLLTNKFKLIYIVFYLLFIIFSKIEILFDKVKVIEIVV